MNVLRLERDFANHSTTDESNICFGHGPPYEFDKTTANADGIAILSFFELHRCGLKPPYESLILTGNF
jgi:hypothetical protein